MINAQSTSGAHMPGRLESLGWPTWKRVGIDTMMDNGVTKLNDKSLSQLIY